MRLGVSICVLISMCRCLCLCVFGSLLASVCLSSLPFLPQGGVTPVHVAAKGGHTATLHALLTTDPVKPSTKRQVEVDADGEVEEEEEEDDGPGLWELFTGQAQSNAYIDVDTLADDVSVIRCDTITLLFVHAFTCTVHHPRFCYSAWYSLLFAW